MRDFPDEMPNGTSFLDHLSAPVRDALQAQAHTCQYRRGAVICLEGEPARSLKLVCSGWIKLFRISTDGNEAVLATLREGQSFNELAALQGALCPASAEAATDCTVMHIDLSGRRSCPDMVRELGLAVLTATSHHLSGMLDQIEGLKVKTGVQRLAEFLLSHCGADHGAVAFRLPYDKYLLAGELGMKPESLSRAFSRLKALGVGTKCRRILIEDVGQLRAFADQDRVLDRAA